jgi:hypothetical protein
MGLAIERLNEIRCRQAAWQRSSCRRPVTCYMDGMFPNRPITAARIVLDDRSRLPWRFFGRLTTAALDA